MHDVTCSHCGKTWRDDHPDLPGAVIWCGDCDRSTPAFPKHVYVKEYHHAPSAWFWKLVATIHDNEGLGFLERLLTGAGIEHKIN